MPVRLATLRWPRWLPAAVPAVSASLAPVPTPDIPPHVRQALVDAREAVRAKKLGQTGSAGACGPPGSPYWVHGLNTGNCISVLTNPCLAGT